MDNLSNFLKQIVERNVSKPSLHYGPGNPDEVWSYQELWQRVGWVARRLQDQGVEKGDRLIIWGPNSPWWVASYFGALRIGAVLVPLDVRSSPDFADRVIEQTEPKLALLAASTRTNWQGPAPYVLMDEIASLGIGDGEPQEVEVGPEDIAVVIFTSGTTSVPKGVILTHGNILFSVAATDKHVPPTPRLHTVSILPLSHMFEQGPGLLMALQRNASIYYLNSISPNNIFGALTQHGATTLLLVPQALQLFISTIEREVAKQGKEKTFESMRKVAAFLPIRVRRMLFRPLHQRLGGQLEFVVSAGAQIRPELIRKWELLGIPVIQAYGSTECSAAVTSTTISDHNPYSVGTPIPGVEVKIAADNEILVKGPNVFKGYWRNEHATNEAFEDGWYKTGDLGRMDGHGYLYFLGRKKDMIALPNGQKVYAVDVEAALKEVEGVVDAAVVGLPTEQGQQVHAALILGPDSPSPQAIIKQANARLAPHQYVMDYTLWPDKEFPSTFTMKVKKHEVLARVVELREQKARPEPAAVAAGR